MKFGGTSVGSVRAIKQLISIVQSSKRPVSAIVVSAFSGITNQLIEAAMLASKRDNRYKAVFNDIAERHYKVIKEFISDKELRKEAVEEVGKTLSELDDLLHGIYLLKELSPKTLDIVMSFGERLSAYIIVQGFKKEKISAEFMDARSFVITDNTFGSARVDITTTYKKIAENFHKKSKAIKIVTGFIASTKKNETTTLGRGGSDYTASLIGAATNASKIEIWTDVDGVLTADPRKVHSAFTVTKMTYEEAMEMSHFGAKVIYPQTMLPAMLRDIPLVIRNTFNPAFEGTTIGVQTSSKFLIKGISSIENIALIQIQGSGMRGIPGIVARLFSALARHFINIILITQASSEYTVCFAIEPAAVIVAKEAIEEEFKHEIRDKLIDKPLIEENLLIIAVVGEQMRKTVGIAGKLFTTLANAHTNVVAIAQGSSERNISFVITQEDERKALAAIHNAFFGK